MIKTTIEPWECCHCQCEVEKCGEYYHFTPTQKQQNGHRLLLGKFSGLHVSDLGVDKENVKKVNDGFIS